MMSERTGNDRMIPRPRHALAILAAATLVACGPGAPSVGSANGDTLSAPPDSAPTAPVSEADSAAVPAGCDDLHYEILQVPPTRQAFAARFGRPDSVISTVEPNRHVLDAVDSLFTVYYPGLIMDIRTPTGARDMATVVRLDDNRYLAYPGIGVGTAASRVREVLGEPHEEGAGYLRYQCSEAVEQPVTFRIAAGRVSAIRIDYYVD